jgi:two-component system response regulator FixJ
LTAALAAGQAAAPHRAVSRPTESVAALLSGSTIGEANWFVIDYKMPFMSGIDLANRLRDRHLDAPITLVTGYPDGNIEEKAAAAGILC